MSIAFTYLTLHKCRLLRLTVNITFLYTHVYVRF